MTNLVENKNIFDKIHSLTPPFGIPDGKVVVSTIQNLKDLIPNSKVSFTKIKVTRYRFRFNVRVVIPDQSVISDSIEIIKALPIRWDESFRREPKDEIGKVIHHFLWSVRLRRPHHISVYPLLEKEGEYRFAFAMGALEEYLRR
ncbi:hypothetical protein OAT46_05865 [Gammaproteobacteria bacterium]|nr:hypothetical protein [Gammaproteobacteria bacterium]